MLEQRRKAVAFSEKLSAAVDQKKQKPKKINRRQFLFFLGATVALTGEEMTLGLVSRLVVEPVEQALREKDILIEGNAGQFILTLRKLVSEFILNPSNENQDLLLAWLKFNAAAQYASHSNKNIAGSLAHHFLYGNGDTLDISELFFRQLDEQLFAELFTVDDFKRLELNQELSDQDKLVVLFEQMLAQYPISSNIYHFIWTPKTVPTSNQSEELVVSSGLYARLLTEETETVFLVGGPNSTLHGLKIRLFGVARLAPLSTLLGLGMFTVAVEGQVLSATETSVTFSQPILYFQDRYDWSKAEDLSARVTIGQITDELGIGNLFVDPVFDSIKDTSFTLEDRHGALLVEHGYAHNFEVGGQFTTDRPVTIHNSFFGQPPSEYLLNTASTVMTVLDP